MHDTPLLKTPAEVQINLTKLMQKPAACDLA